MNPPIDPEDLKRLFPGATASTLKVNKVLIAIPPKPAVKLEVIDYKPRKPKVEEGLNKLETKRLAYLRMLKVPLLRVQAIKLRLADNTHYTADFTYLDVNGKLTFEDTKGPHIWEDSWIKAKVAASLYPEYRFVVVREDGMGWTIQEAFC